MSEYERICADWERLKAKEEAVIREAHARMVRDLEAEIARLRPLTVRSATCCEACAPMDRTLREALAKVAALEARLAEVAVVVEAAERQEAAQSKYAKQGGDGLYVQYSCATGALEDAVVEMRAARSKREGGA